MVGELAVGRPVGLDQVEPEPFDSGPTIGPAMPLPSTTTLSGRTAPGSITESACSWKAS